MRPPITAMAMGRRTSLPGPSASADGTAAIMVASDVIRMGRSRTGPAASIASFAPRPLPRCCTA